VPSAALLAGTVPALAGRCAGTATPTRFENAVEWIVAAHRKEQHPMIETIAHAAVYRRDVGTMQSLSMFTLLTVGVLPSIEGFRPRGSDDARGGGAQTSTSGRI
jgi:hypothetical protein